MVRWGDTSSESTTESTTMGCKEVTSVPVNQKYSIAPHPELSYTETINGYFGDYLRHAE